MTSHYLGIDPGKEGAFVLIDENKNIILSKKMPMIKLAKKEEYDLLALISFFKAIQQFTNLHIYLEQINAMPGQGVTSMFSMGRGVGLLEMGVAFSGL